VLTKLPEKATFLNNIAFATFIGCFIVPIFGHFGEPDATGYAIGGGFGLLLALGLHLWARRILNEVE
jgi:hypothetical protein